MVPGCVVWRGGGKGPGAGLKSAWDTGDPRTQASLCFRDFQWGGGPGGQPGPAAQARGWEGGDLPNTSLLDPKYV